MRRGAYRVLQGNQYWGIESFGNLCWAPCPRSPPTLREHGPHKSAAARPMHSMSSTDAHQSTHVVGLAELESRLEPGGP